MSASIPPVSLQCCHRPPSLDTRPHHQDPHSFLAPAFSASLLHTDFVSCMSPHSASLSTGLPPSPASIHSPPPTDVPVRVLTHAQICGMHGLANLYMPVCMYGGEHECPGTQMSGGTCTRGQLGARWVTEEVWRRQ